MTRPAAFLFIAAGGTVSAFDWAGVCTEACAEASLYRLFGLLLPPLGVAYFALCAALLLAERRHRVFRPLLAFLLFAGLGAEIVFTWIQAYVIGKWCPMCVAIAACVAGACGAIVWEHFSRTTAILPTDERKPFMKRSAAHAALVLFALLAGLGTAALGLKKPDAFAAGLTPEMLAFGPADSSRVVYFVSDWFCPACRTAEPEILKGAGLAMKQAKVFFVDYPIHQETLNYIPYNLSFMVHEKKKYLQIREALAALARNSKEPKPEDVQAAVSPLGVRYAPLGFADVLAGTQFQMSVVRQFKPSGTPEVVVTDTKSGKTIKISGSAEITTENILRAISEVSGK